MFLITAIPTRKTSPTPEVVERHFTSKPEVAELRNKEVAELSCTELIEAIRAAKLPCLLSNFEHRLEFCDREMLKKLTYLARRCCRNQGY